MLVCAWGYPIWSKRVSRCTQSNLALAIATSTTYLKWLQQD